MSSRSRFITTAWPWVRARHVPLLTLFLGVLVPMWLFGQFAQEVLERESMAHDQALLLLVRAHAGPLLDRLMLGLSLVGSIRFVLPAALLVALVLGARRRWRGLTFWVLALGGSQLLNLGAKQTFQRGRPDLWVSIAPESSFSFPSGHAMQSMTLVAATLVLVWPTRWRWPALVAGGLFAGGVGLSRMYLGVHFPSDVLGGWLAAVAWVLGVHLVLTHRVPGRPVS